MIDLFVPLVSGAVNLVKSAEVYLQKSFVQVSESEEFLSIGFKEVNEIIGDYIMLKNGIFLVFSSILNYWYVGNWNRK